MGDNAVSCRTAGSWRGKAPHAVAAAAVAAVIALTGAACSTATSSASTRVKAPAVIVHRPPATATCSSGGAAVPYISEFSPTGQLLFNAQLPGTDITYRAYRMPWLSSGL